MQRSTCCRVGGVRDSLKTLSTGMFADGRCMDGDSHSGGHLVMTALRAILLANSQYRKGCGEPTRIDSDGKNKKVSTKS